MQEACLAVVFGIFVHTQKQGAFIGRVEIPIIADRQGGAVSYFAYQSTHVGAGKPVVLICQLSLDTIGAAPDNGERTAFGRPEALGRNNYALVFLDLQIYLFTVANRSISIA